MRRIRPNQAAVWTICVLLAMTITACRGPGDTGQNESEPNTATSQHDPESPTDTNEPAATTGSTLTSTPTVAAPSGTATTPPQVDGTPTIPPPATMSPTLNPTQVYSTPEVPDPTATQNSNPEPAEGVLPHSRVLSFYGHPNSSEMGILGEYGTKEEALTALEQLAAEYLAADPSRPVVPAFELIATVAHPHPGEDGDYLGETGPELIQEYIDFTAANDMLLILDLQIGHDTIPNQIDKIRDYLMHSHVHVALDPEFATAANPAVPRDRAPGEFIGEVNGHDVNLAIQMLSDLVTQHGLPRKMLIVHQFEDEMIYNKYVITPQPGVDFVLDMDGFGGPEAKVSNYNYYVQEELIELGGIKLFFQQDAPLLTPAEIVALQPAPLVVIYQ